MSATVVTTLSSELEAPPAKRSKLSESSTCSVPNGVETLQGRKSFVAPSQKLHYGDYPLKIVKSRGQYLYDDKNQRYLDACNNVSHVGHCNPRVTEAAIAQMSVLNTNSRFLNDRIVTYAKHLCSLLPPSLSCCFFTNSGSEANDLALQIAQVATGRKTVVGLEGAYHGHLMSLKPLSNHKLSHGSSLSGDVVIAPIPDNYRGKYTDPSTAAQLYAADFTTLVKDKEISAFIHESVLSCGGQVVPPEGYLKSVYQEVRSSGGLCIADEVQTGFGRMGEHYWAFEAHGVVPDIVTLGKPMGNGHPVSGVVTTREIADKFAGCGVEYFNTFGGNPVSMATAEAVLNEIEDNKLQSHAREVGTELKSRLRALQEKHSCIGDVRGTGLFLGVDFVQDKLSRKPDSDTALYVQQHLLLEHKIIALADGMYNNVIKIKPPMVITDKDCTSIVEGIDQILSQRAPQTP